MNFTMRSKLGAEAIAFGKSTETLYFSLIGLEGHFLVYVATIDLVPEPDGDRICWTGSNYRFRDIARIKATEPAYKRFIADTQRRTGIASFFATGTEEDGDTDKT